MTVKSAVLSLGALLAAAPASAQTVITGTVLGQATEQPIEGVELVLLDEGGTIHNETRTDSDGWFRFAVPGGGRWIIAGSMIGYAELRSDPVDIEVLETVVVEVRMAVEAVPLEPLVVTSRISHINADLKAFYDRMARGRRSGLGRYISREDIERASALEPTDLLRTMAGVRIVRGTPGRGKGIRMSGGCIPAVYVDGAHVNRFNPRDSLDDFVGATSIEGIEVYRGAGAQVGRFYDPGGCGLVLVWTRRGAPEGSPFSWTKLAIGAGLLIALILAGT